MARDLAQRAEQSVQRQGDGGESLQQQMAKMESQFQRAMPKGAEAVQLIRDVMTCVSRTPKLAEAARTKAGALSIIGSAMTCAQLGLRPGVGALGHAWILPFWDNKSREQRAQLIIGYKGYVDLGQRSDRIGSLHTRVVYEHDEFRLKYGLSEDDFEHTPYFMLGRDEPGATRLFYAVGRLSNGGTAVADPMTLKQMQEHRDKFAMAKYKGEIVGPWRDHFEAMAKKTMLLRLMALMPKSTEMERAITNDGSVRMDLAPDAIDDPNVVDGEVLGDAVDEPAGEPQRESVTVRERSDAPAPPPEDIPPPPEPPVQDVPMASRTQLGQLKNIRQAERYDTDAEWLDYIAAATGARVAKDGQLTADQAQTVIDIFNSDNSDTASTTK